MCDGYISTALQQLRQRSQQNVFLDTQQYKLHVELIHTAFRKPGAGPNVMTQLFLTFNNSTPHIT